MKKLINILKKDHFLIGEIIINEIINFYSYLIFNLKNNFVYYKFL